MKGDDYDPNSFNLKETLQAYSDDHTIRVADKSLRRAKVRAQEMLDKLDGWSKEMFLPFNP